MDEIWKTMVWQQFGAAIDMLDDAITLCPDSLWTAAISNDDDDPRYGQFWFIAYHTLFWLDLYLGGSQDGFAPPAPFIRGALPENPYTKADVSNYLRQCRQKCETTLKTLTDERARQVCTFEWIKPTFLELQIYNMRHVQEHAAQLSLVLGQNGVAGIDWVAQARNKAE